MNAPVEDVLELQTYELPVSPPTAVSVTEPPGATLPLGGLEDIVRLLLLMVMF